MRIISVDSPYDVYLIKSLFIVIVCKYKQVGKIDFDAFHGFSLYRLMQQHQFTFSQQQRKYIVSVYGI